MRLLFRFALCAGFLLALVVGGFVLYFDHFARTGIESEASWALGVDTRLGSLHLSPVAGRITLGGLRVANPPGFERASFLELTSGKAEVDIWTIRDDVIEIPRIELSGLEISLEQTATGANYDAIVANLDRKRGRSAADEGGTGQKVVVRELVIRDITAHTSLRSFGKQMPKLDLEIPEIRLTDLGDGGSMEISELTGIITRALLYSVAKKSGALPAEFARGLANRLGDGAQRALRKGLGRLLGGDD